MADGNNLFPAPRLVLAALAAGVLAGAVAVYVSESRSGNNAPAQVAVGASKDDVACAAKAERAKKVAAQATGQVAALLPADPPQSLKSLAFNGPDGKPMKSPTMPARRCCSICGRHGARPAAPKCRRSTRCRRKRAAMPSR